MNLPVSHWQKVLIADPNNADALHAIGTSYAKEHKFDRAVSFFYQATVIKADNPGFFFDLGHGLLLTGKTFPAVCAFRQALKLDPSFAAAYEGLGKALCSLGETDLAITCLHKAVNISPKFSNYLSSLAWAYCIKKEYSKALVYAKQAIKITPNSRPACLSVIESLFGLGKIQLASNILLKHLRRDKNWLEGHYSMGLAMYNLRNVDKAVLHFRKVFVNFPHHANARYGFAMCLLLRGDFLKGWVEYESRMQTDSFKRSRHFRFTSKFVEPMWSGEDLKGKTLLVYAEQGFGDVIQFIRYLPLLAQEGCRIILLAYPELVPLFRHIKSIWQLRSFGDLIPRFDYYVALCSLPRLLKTTVETIPSAIPYLRPPSRPSSRVRLSGKYKFRIAFVWSSPRRGAFDYRSVDLHFFESLLEIKDIQFLSIQAGSVRNELAVFQQKYSNLLDLGAHIKDFGDTAYFISQADLVLSIDTSVAHLAGALGRPVYLLLPPNGEWRWLLGHNRPQWAKKSPWYPTMQIFRCRKINAWDPVFTKIRHCLIKKLNQSLH